MEVVLPKPAPVELIFQMERETRNKIRFSEMSPVEGGKSSQPVPKDKAVVDKLYISKAQLKKMGNPEILHVTISAP